MEQIKTICVDKYGDIVSEKLKDFFMRYEDKIEELTKEFANESVDLNIENSSAYGMFFTSVARGLASAYFQRKCDDLPILKI